MAMWSLGVKQPLRCWGLGLSLLGAVSTLAAAEEGASPAQLWQQIEFTATEVLIYTDQLQKLDATACSASPVSQHSTAATRAELLQLLPEADRQRLDALFASPMVQTLLQENSDGIRSMLGHEQVAGGAPSEKLRNACLELSLSFSENQRQAREELEQLIGAYRER
ncbi:MAG TPA: hypothetical protein VIS52_00860 [Motiliproteus sp.]